MAKRGEAPGSPCRLGASEVRHPRTSSPDLLAGIPRVGRVSSLIDRMRSDWAEWGQRTTDRPEASTCGRLAVRGVRSNNALLWPLDAEQDEHVEQAGILIRLS